MLPGMILSIFSLLTVNPGHVAWRAALLCCFRGLLRKCQVTMSDSTLRRQDFVFYSWGMIITIRKTKTIQFRQRKLQIPIAKCKDKRLCAVYWTDRHFRELPSTSDSLAFRIPHGSGSSPLTYNLYEKTLKVFVARAGMNPADFSSHSLRRGGCTYLSMCGATLEELRTRGDWSSDTIFAYLKTPITHRIVHDMRVASSLDSYESSLGLGAAP